MDRGAYSANASASAPSAPAAPSAAYPTDGDPLTALAATIPGAWWFHAVTEEIRNTLVLAGITPDYEDTTQLAAAVVALAGAPQLVKQTTAAQAYTLYGQYTFAHTLGVEPGVVQLKARCLTAEGGYSVNDVVFVTPGTTDDTSAANDLGWAITATTTNIYLSLDKNHGMYMHEWNNTSRFLMTPGNWEFFFFAMA